MKIREFGEGATARHVVAETIARRRQREHVPPMDWADAGAIVEALKEAGFPMRRPSGASQGARRDSTPKA